MLLACFVPALAGCSTLLIPSARISDPVEVFIVDHGRTSSLVIPGSDGGLLRYAYGDWNYYALKRTNLLHGAAALLWPTRGALGRAPLPGPANLSNVHVQLPGTAAVHAVCVERARVRAFEARMEGLYEEHRRTKVENRAYGLSFVHHPRAYTYFWNSNHAVASWLREMGMRTRGLSFRADWRVAEAPPCARPPPSSGPGVEQTPHPEAKKASADAHPPAETLVSPNVVTERELSESRRWPRECWWRRCSRSVTPSSAGSARAAIGRGTLRSRETRRGREPDTSMSRTSVLLRVIRYPACH